MARPPPVDVAHPLPCAHRRAQGLTIACALGSAVPLALILLLPVPQRLRSTSQSTHAPQDTSAVVSGVSPRMQVARTQPLPPRQRGRPAAGQSQTTSQDDGLGPCGVAKSAGTPASVHRALSAVPLLLAAAAAAAAAFRMLRLRRLRDSRPWAAVALASDEEAAAQGSDGACGLSLGRVAVSTEEGEFVIECDFQKAPLTCGYVRQLVDRGAYSDGRASFFRIVPSYGSGVEAATINPGVQIHVLQGGLKPDALHPIPNTIPLESTERTGLRHVKWAVSLARRERWEPYGSFFVCMEDEKELDCGGRRHPDGQGFAVFGKVVEGFDVLDRIYFTRREEGEMLQREVKFLQARFYMDNSSTSQH